MLKILVMIDGNYLRISARNLGYENFSHEKLAKALVDKASEEMEAKYRLLRVYYYDSPPLMKHKDLTEKEIEFARKRQSFLDSLNSLKNFEVVLGRIQYKGRNKYTGKLITVQKGVDVRMAIDIIDFAEKRVTDAILLVTGDSDLIPAIKSAKTKGVNVLLAMFSNKKSKLVRELRNSADIVIQITPDMFEPYK